MAGVSATATKALDNKQFKKFRLCCNLTVWVFLVLGFVIGFAGAMSAEGLEKVISLIPTWLNTGLSVAGAMLPAIGFAMILNVMAKKELIPFVLLGYCAIAYFKLPIIGVAILGTTVALLVHFYTGKGNKSGTETEEVINERMRRAADESELMDRYEYLVINDQLEKCVEEVHQLIQRERFRMEQNQDMVTKLQNELKAMKGE